MATRYFIGTGGASNWNSAATWSSTADGLTTPASFPVAGDTVLPSAICLAGSSLVLNVPAFFGAMDWTGAANPIAITGTSYTQMNGSVTFAAGMTISNTNVWEWTGAGNYTLTMGGATFTATSFGSAGAANINLTLGDNCDIGSSSIGWRSHNGTFNTAGFTVTCSSFANGYSTNVIITTLGASVINCTAFSVTAQTVITANTSVINVTGTGIFAAAGQTTFQTINLNGTSHVVSGSFTCVILTRNGTATKTDSVTFTSGTTVTCTTFAMIGNSAINRLLVQSSSLGSPATITATNWTGSLYFDLMDITATNAVDFTALGIIVGDCGGNTNITCSSSAGQMFTDTGDHLWSTAANWTSRIPLPQDNVSVPTGNTVTIDMPRIGRSISFSGTPTITLSNAIGFYGSWTMVSGMTFTHANLFIVARGRGSYTITTAGVTIYALDVNAPSGTLTQLDSITASNAESCYLSAGTWAMGAFDLTCGVFTVRNAQTKVLSGSGTMTLNSTGAITKFNYSGSSATVSGTSTIILTNSTASAQTFAGGGLTYNNLTIQGAGAYALTMTGNNTFNILTIDRSEAAKTLILTGTTQIVTDLRLLVSGTTTISITGGTISKAGSTVSSNYLVLTNSTASGGASFYAGANSTNGGGNSGWVFSNSPIRGVWK